MVWSPTLISLFFQCKNNLTTSPLLLRFDGSKLVFLKTDWSATGMEFIVIQLDNSPESLLELHHLSNTGECRFDLTMKDARLCHVAFGFRSNRTFEVHYHSLSVKSPAIVGVLLKTSTIFGENMFIASAVATR